MISPASPRLRADLVHACIDVGERQMWVVKDPLSRDYFYFDDREYAILRLLNGQRSFANVVEKCKRLFGPAVVASDVIERFIHDVAANGLLTGCPNRSRSKHNESWIQRVATNPLAFRLPGFHPDRFFAQVRRLFGFQGSVNSQDRRSNILLWLFAWALFVGWAMLMVIANFGDFSDHVSVAAMRTGGSFWITLGITIACTKVIHELAHAAVAKRFGAECREMGLMLLVGVPCLYCDVTDAWTLKQRWKRILVSAAGMMAELFLAALAVVLWLGSDVGTLRDLCVTVIVVCSVNTVLFNGNPLLRYDGYFIASDLLGIPNLRQLSSQSINHCYRRLLGIPSVSCHGFWKTAGLLAYGISSWLYRSIVFCFIVAMLFQFLSRMHLRPIAVGLVVAAMLLPLISGIRFVIHSPKNHTGNLWRGRLVIVAAFVLISIFLFTPVPRKVVAPMIVAPARSVPVIAAQSGVLQRVSGQPRVRKGELIAELKSPALELKLARHSAESTRLSVLIETLKKRRLREPNVASEIPAVERRLADSQSKVRLVRQEMQSLVVRSPADGEFFSSRKRMNAKTESANAFSLSMPSWQGDPLCPENVGAFLQRGTILGYVGDRGQREALAFVHEDSIELIRPQQAVVVRSAFGDSSRGVVREISAAPVSELPQELLAADRIERNTPNKRFYQVRILLNQRERPMPVRMTAMVAIRTRPASLFTRLTRALWQTLRL